MTSRIHRVRDGADATPDRLPTSSSATPTGDDVVQVAITRLYSTGTRRGGNQTSMPTTQDVVRSS